MESFFYTADTAPEGVGFDAFGLGHILWLVGLVITLVICGILYRRASDAAAAKWRKVMAILLLVNEVLIKQLPMILMGNWSVGHLPLHLCSVNICLVAWHAWKGGKLLGEFSYTVCIPGALAALLFPNWTDAPIYALTSIHSFSVHIQLVLYPVLLLVRGDIRPSWRRIPQCLALLVALAAVAFVANQIFDTNFFFLSWADEGNPLYWFEANWGSHLLGFPVLISAVLLVMHLPLVIVEKLRKTKNA